jgi:cell division septation protein DedD
MRKLALGLIILMVVCLGMGCNKNKEKVAQLEHDVTQAESENYLKDTTAPDQLEIDSNALAAENSVASERNPGEIPPENVAVSPAEPGMSKTPPEIHKAAAADTPMRGGYTVQVGAGVDRGEAEKMADLFTRRGYQPFIAEAVVEGMTHYRVRIGNFPSLDEARKLGAELQEKYSVNFWIDKNPQ